MDLRSPPKALAHEATGTDTSSRHSSCTHTRMTRLYDEYGADVCSICRRHPSIGWLYRCTQDSQGVLPESDFRDVATSAGKRRYTEEDSLHHLSPSIIKAIGQGHYNEEQISRLIEQKENLRNVILEQTTRPQTRSTLSDASSTFSSIPASSTLSSLAAASIDEEIRLAYNWSGLQHGGFLELPPGNKDELSAILESENSKDEVVTTSCEFKVCPTCRPTYKERAYESLNSVLNQTVRAPLQCELDNRRVSDARVVAHIGLPKAAQSHWSDENTSSGSLDTPNYFISHTGVDAGGNGGNFLSPWDATPYDHSVRRRSGFRETVRKTLKRAELEDPRPSPVSVDSVDHESGSTAVLSNFSRSMLLVRRRSQKHLTSEEPHSSMVGSRPLRDSLMLVLASNTPLPSSTSTLHIKGGVDRPQRN